jgi:hypothetical protein
LYSARLNRLSSCSLTAEEGSRPRSDDAVSCRCETQWSGKRTDAKRSERGVRVGRENERVVLVEVDDEVHRLRGTKVEGELERQSQLSDRLPLAGEVAGEGSDLILMSADVNLESVKLCQGGKTARWSKGGQSWMLQRTRIPASTQRAAAHALSVHVLNGLNPGAVGISKKDDRAPGRISRRAVAPSTTGGRGSRTLEAALAELADAARLEQVDILEDESLHRPVWEALDDAAARRPVCYEAISLPSAAFSVS